MADAWVDGRHYECLVDACALLLSMKDDKTSPLNRVAVEFIRQSASRLQKGGEASTKEGPRAACSFCGKSAPEVRLGAGPQAFICNECVATFHSVLRSHGEETST